MAVYNPPTEDLPIFDNNVFTSGNEVLTVDVANNTYLKFPLAQGAETLTDVTVLGTSDFGGAVTVNSTITQIGASDNIIQDNTSNLVPNIFKRSNIYGDLVLRPPLSVVGSGGIKYYDINGSTPASNIYQYGTTSIFENLGISGQTTFSCTSATTLKTLLRMSTAGGTIVQSAQTDNSGQILTVTETGSGKTIGFIPNSTSGLYNPLVLTGDNQLICGTGGGAQGTQTYITGIWSTVCNGLRIKGSTNTTEIGQGGTGGVFTTSFSCNGTNSIIKGPAQFSSTTPPTSAQTIPLPSDSSDKIPTTAWVQSAISVGGNIPLYLRGYSYLTNPTTQYPLTIGTIPINFTNGATLPANTSFTIRFSIRYDFNITSSTAQSNLFYGAYGNLVVFPYRVETNTLSIPVYLNGSLNGSMVYGYTDPTVAPRGRYIWTENFSNPELLNGSNQQQNPVYFTSTTQSSLTFNISLPYSASLAPTSCCSLAVYLELINTSTGTTISTGNTSFFDSVVKNF